ncbi:hypothetical protein OROGR_028273 [Orobanche gracilis]
MGCASSNQSKIVWDTGCCESGETNGDAAVRIAGDKALIPVEMIGDPVELPLDHHPNVHAFAIDVGEGGVYSDGDKLSWIGSNRAGVEIYTDYMRDAFGQLLIRLGRYHG